MFVGNASDNLLKKMETGTACHSAGHDGLDAGYNGFLHEQNCDAIAHECAYLRGANDAVGSHAAFPVRKCDFLRRCAYNACFGANDA
jgi:hypothetical protein